MVYNYPGSVADEDMQFLSEVSVENSSTNELFNAISIYVPMSKAVGNIIGFDDQLVAVDKPAVYTCVVENYASIMTGALLDQWQDVFRQDTNNSVILYLIVFLDGTGTSSFWEITPTTIKFTPLTNAFNKLYFISYFKVLFDELYETDMNNTLYFDMSLALAYLCKLDVKLSYFLTMVRQHYPVESPDTNVCLVSSASKAQELAAATALDATVAGVDAPRDAYYWGMLFLLNFSNWAMVVHSEPVNLIPIILAAWFAQRNSSGTFIGNKLSKLRLSGSRIKPNGVPSWLNAAVNENIGGTVAEILKDKKIGFLKTISDSTEQDCELASMASADGMPTIAMQISKWVDYTSAQQCAEFATDAETLTFPVLRNEVAYKSIQGIVMNNLQLFTGTGRLSSISMNFPSFSDLPKSKTDIIAASSWSAVYQDDLGKVLISGGITA
jgi:hypothetical protein